MKHHCKGCTKSYPGCKNVDACEDWRKVKEHNERVRSQARKEREAQRDYFQSTRNKKKGKML